MNGNNIEEEKEILEIRKRRKNENLFKASSYEKYLWLKSKNKLRGE